MPKRSDFVDHVVETMRVFGPVACRSMFGGWGLYHRGAFFALIARDTLYLKVDDANRARFEAEGQGPCEFPMKNGKTLVLSYHRPPDEALESPDVMAEWARLGYGAALRARAAKKKRASA